MILVCFAVEQEARPFLRRASALAHVRTAVTGMGRAATQKTLSRELELHVPKAVLTCGFAGALNPELRLGQVLYSTDPAFPLQLKLKEAGARPGTFFCSENVLISGTQKSAARQQTGADAVEMESRWVRTLCEGKGIPSATVRVILDEANVDLPLDFNTIMDTRQRIRLGKLAGAIVRDPKLAGGLLRLGRDSRRAAEQLARVLCEALG